MIQIAYINMLEVKEFFNNKLEVTLKNDHKFEGKLLSVDYEKK